MSLSRAVLSFGMLIVAFDAVWATIASVGGYDYQALGWVSFILWGLAAFVAARATTIPLGIVAGTLVAAIDATIGWAVSMLIGPGIPKVPLTASLVIFTVIFVIVMGAVIATVGALLSRLPVFRRS